MAITSGFFDSLENSPRRYTAEQFGSIFDGLISDGVYENYPGKGPNNTTIPPFQVTPVTGQGSSYTVNVGPGRAWFNHLWILNDSTNFDINAPHITFDRMDTILLKVDKNSRECRLVYNPGSADGNVQPDIQEDDTSVGIYYYPIAYIRVPKNAGSSANFVYHSAIGTSTLSNAKVTPYVAAIVKPSMTMENYVNAYWQSVQDWEHRVEELIDPTATVVDYASEIASLEQRVDDLEDSTSGESGIGTRVDALETHNTNVTDPAITALNGYFDSGMPYFGTGVAFNINGPGKSICRVRLDGTNVTGTKPKGMDNQILLITLNPSASANYNVQLAIGFVYGIAIRVKRAGSWQAWKYLPVTASKL